MKMIEGNYLKLSLEPDDDGTGKLTAEFHANGFAGVGSAYFNLEEIAKFGESLQAYPLYKGQQLKIEGGYWTVHKFFKKSKLQEVHLFIKIYLVSETGILGLRVKIQTPSTEGTVNMASGAFETGYNNLESFSKQIAKMLKKVGGTEGDVLEIYKFVFFLQALYQKFLFSGDLPSHIEEAS